MAIVKISGVHSLKKIGKISMLKEDNNNINSMECTETVMHKVDTSLNSMVYMEIRFNKEDSRFNSKLIRVVTLKLFKNQEKDLQHKDNINILVD